MAGQIYKPQKNSWVSSLKNFFTSRKQKDNSIPASKTVGNPAQSTVSAKSSVMASDTVSYDIRQDDQFLHSIEKALPPDIPKAEFVKALLRMVPEDFDYLYYDGEFDNSNPLRKLAHKVAIQAFNHLPDDPSSLDSLGFSFIELGDHERALKCYLRKSEKDADDGAAWNNIAWCQMRMGKYNEAFEVCKHALKFFPNHPHVQHDYACILAGLRRIDEAIPVLTNAISNLKPQAIQLHYLLAILLERKGDTKSAINCWKEFLRLAEDKIGHERAISRVQNKLQKYGVTVSLRKRQMSEIHDQTTVFNSLAISQMLCLSQHLQLVKNDPRKIDAQERIKIGQTMEQILQHHNKMVVELYHKWKKLSIDHRVILARHYVFLSLANLLQWKLDGVEEWLKRALTLDKDSKETQPLLYAYYVIKVMQGVNENEELNLLQSALRIDQRPGHAHILLARHYCIKGKYKQVAEILKQINEVEKKSKIDDEYERGLLEEAKFGVTLWSAVGKIREDKDSEALSIVNDLKLKKPESPEPKYWLAVINIRRGSYSTAKDILATIPADVIPEKTLSELRSIISKNERIRDSSDNIIFNLRSPRMTGSSSSPICKRFFRALIKRLTGQNKGKILSER